MLHSSIGSCNKKSDEQILEQIDYEFENVIITLLLNQPINLENQIREKAYFLSIDNPLNSPEKNWFDAKKYYFNIRKD